MSNDTTETRAITRYNFDGDEALYGYLVTYDDYAALERENAALRRKLGGGERGGSMTNESWREALANLAAETLSEVAKAIRDFPLPKHQESQPVAWVLTNSDGKMYWEREECVWSCASDSQSLLDDLTNNEPDHGWHVTPLYASAKMAIECGDIFKRRAELAEQQLAECRKVQQDYGELIMAVGNKYLLETRHQTALRYIKNAEDRFNSPDSCAKNSVSPETKGEKP